MSIQLTGMQLADDQQKRLNHLIDRIEVHHNKIILYNNGQVIAEGEVSSLVLIDLLDQIANVPYVSLSLANTASRILLNTYQGESK